MPINYQGDGRVNASTVYAGTGNIGALDVSGEIASLTGLQIGTNFNDPYGVPAIPVADGRLTLTSLSALTFEYQGAGIPAGGFGVNAIVGGSFTPGGVAEGSL